MQQMKLGYSDSNQEKQDQNLLCYHYTIAQNQRTIVIKRMNETTTLIEKIIEGIQEKKGKQIVVADLNEIEDTICKYFIICQGNSPSQVLAIVDSIKEHVRKETGTKAYAIDGQRYIYFCRKYDIFIIWNTYGQMPN